MALKARTTKQFKVDVKILEEGEVIEIKNITFNFPRAIDYHRGNEGNAIADLLYTYANMAQRFEKPLQYPAEDGSIYNIYTLREVLDLGYGISISEIDEKWKETKLAIYEETDKLLKKSKLAGNSEKRDTVVDKN